MTKSVKIDCNQSIADLITQWPKTIPVFLRHKMLCVGCMVSPFHTIVDACAEHSLDQAAFIADLERQSGDN